MDIYKTSRGARRSRRVPVVRTHRAERLGHGPRRALGNCLAEVVREVRNEGHELERLDDVEGAVAVVAQHVDGAVAMLGEKRAPRGEGRVRHAEVVDERDDDGPHAVAALPRELWSELADRVQRAAVLQGLALDSCCHRAVVKRTRDAIARRVEVLRGVTPSRNCSTAHANAASGTLGTNVAVVVARGTLRRRVRRRRGGPRRRRL